MPLVFLHRMEAATCHWVRQHVQASISTSLPQSTQLPGLNVYRCACLSSLRTKLFVEDGHQVADLIGDTLWPPDEGFRRSWIRSLSDSVAVEDRAAPPSLDASSVRAACQVHHLNFDVNSRISAAVPCRIDSSNSDADLPLSW